MFHLFVLPFFEIKRLPEKNDPENFYFDENIKYKLCLGVQYYESKSCVNKIKTQLFKKLDYPLNKGVSTFLIRRTI